MLSFKCQAADEGQILCACMLECKLCPSKHFLVLVLHLTEPCTASHFFLQVVAERTFGGDDDEALSNLGPGAELEVCVCVCVCVSISLIEDARLAA